MRAAQLCGERLKKRGPTHEYDAGERKQDAAARWHGSERMLRDANELRTASEVQRCSFAAPGGHYSKRKLLDAEGARAFLDGELAPHGSVTVCRSPAGPVVFVHEGRRAYLRVPGFPMAGNGGRCSLKFLNVRVPRDQVGSGELRSHPGFGGFVRLSLCS